MLKDTTDKEETGSINFDEFKRIYWLNVFRASCWIQISGIFVAVGSWFHALPSSFFQMKAFKKKVFKKLFSVLGKKSDI